MNTPRTEVIAQRCSTDGEYSDVQAYNVMYAHARQLETQVQELRDELTEVLIWATTERSALREQEIKSISAILEKTS